MTNTEQTITTQTARKTINGHHISIEIRPVSVKAPTYVITCGCGQDGPWEAYYASAAEVTVSQHTAEPPAEPVPGSTHETYVEFEGPTYYWWCSSTDCDEEPEHYESEAEAQDAAAEHERQERAKEYAKAKEEADLTARAWRRAVGAHLARLADEDDPHPVRTTGADEVQYAVESEDEWV